MGEIAHVDLERLRATADGVAAAGDAVAQMRWPALDAGALPDSAVAALPIADVVGGQVAEVVADLIAWVAAAREAAEAFVHADAALGERLAVK
ncbi:hypothetical protein FHR72_004478 [Mycolicibacterium iranicum]|uniref:PE domain-containing protein n=1 Tax=Mycolicibacterium iranicum TaxID=912594 RepID=A0A839QL87_MYCIR|nr:hypothetical protein [Mycolicibacterium iranicum]MBB2992971.1 hypothetical protein [Mycolicibacterium iranicum]